MNNGQVMRYRYRIASGKSNIEENFNDQLKISAECRRYFEDILLEKGISKKDVLHICGALDEAVKNAVVHGNFGVRSSWRDYPKVMKYHFEELDDNVVCASDVRITCDVYKTRIEICVEDSGNGFDQSMVADPRLPENMVNGYGRGLVMINSFMDDVTFNDSGNTVTMVKYREKTTD